MPVSLLELIGDINPGQTVLVFGAGASVPSGAPSVADLVQDISQEFRIESGGLNLREISGLAEQKRSRQDVISIVRKRFSGLRAKGSILNLPLYGWKSIFTTNYDEIVEDAYKRAGRSIKVFSSNFDFTVQSDPNAAKLFKIHGTIDKDVVDGSLSRIIITDGDYDLTEEYREVLYDRLKADISPGVRVLIIGQSLADQDLRDVIQRSIAINQKMHNQGRIGLLLYERDENRAQLLESRGVRVAYGGLDDFIAALALKAQDHAPAQSRSGDLLDSQVVLRPGTKSIDDELKPEQANASAVFNGWPANYSDISGGLTFDRVVAGEITEYYSDSEKFVAVLLGASGVGKTTAARQVLLKLRGRGYDCWEHKGEHPLNERAWVEIAKRLKIQSKMGALLIDDAHTHLYEVNELVDRLASEGCTNFKLIFTSTRSHWGPRVKTPTMFSMGSEFYISQLSSKEIDNLLTLVETVPELRSLVESGFGGFSRYERRRRLIDRCEADMFVCMKNIFASEKYDDIILREYGTLSVDNQDIYRYVAAMEYAGIRVHRQLVMRILGLQANAISALLSGLADIITEYDVNPREGVYGWRVRHNVIAGIVAKYKFYDLDKLIELFGRVIDHISPTFDIEIRTIRELCNIESGLSVIPDKSVQNQLLRRMMSIAPGERVPRHRLIRNLIDLGEFEKAESEIRIFEKDFGKEAPTARYRILLMIARATETPGLAQEDRMVILQQARELASGAVVRYETNKYVLGAYCELGIETFKLTGSHEVFDEAMKLLKRAESRVGDPDVTKMVVRYQRRISGQSVVDRDSTGLSGGK